MPAGFQLFGEDEVVWADTNLMPIGLIKSGPLVNGQNLITVPGKNPTIFFTTDKSILYEDQLSPRIVKSLVRLKSISQSGGNFTFNVQCSLNNQSNPDPLNKASYWIFDSAPPLGGGNFGLQVFDASGLIIFNSNNPPVRITAFLRSHDEFHMNESAHYRIDAYTPIPGGFPANAAFTLSTFRQGFIFSQTGQNYVDAYNVYAGMTTTNRLMSIGDYVSTTNISGVEPGEYSYQSIPWITVIDTSFLPMPFN